VKPTATFILKMEVWFQSGAQAVNLLTSVFMVFTCMTYNIPKRSLRSCQVWYFVAIAVIEMQMQSEEEFKDWR
jgi:hypothetical protein